MRVATRVLFFFATIGLVACAFTESKPSDVAKGLTRAILVHRFAMAFRDHIRHRDPVSLLPAPLLAPLPLTAAEWSADAAPQGVTVMSLTAGIGQESRVDCSAQTCVRRVYRHYPKGDVRLDEKLVVTYARANTEAPNDDTVIGFEQTVRYRDQTVARTATTAPASAQPWVVFYEVVFASGDARLRLTQRSDYATMTSSSTPNKIDWSWETKSSRSHTQWKWLDNTWSYAQHTTYDAEAVRRRGKIIYHAPIAGVFTATLSATQFRATHSLRYENGRMFDFLNLIGQATTWQSSGQSVLGGLVRIERESDFRRRTVTIPPDKVFSRIVEEGSYRIDGGSFRQTLENREGAKGVLSGTYRMKSHGVWEVVAESTGLDNLRVEFTYQVLDFGEVILGRWSQTNGDAAEFRSDVFPDTTARLHYEFDSANGRFPVDEFGALRFFPDTRAVGTVSIVLDDSGGTLKHTDYTVGALAEGE